MQGAQGGPLEQLKRASRVGWWAHAVQIQGTKD